MQYRTCAIFTGAKFQVPGNVQRIDQAGTHGWQLRYGSGEDGTLMFSDFTTDGSGAAAALELAIKELHKRIRRLPAPTGLRKQPMSRKTTGHPAGISGPYLRNASKPGKTTYWCFQVSVPLPSGGSTTKSVYIGTEKTATVERGEVALAKAIEIRNAAVEKYELAKTRSKRAAAAESLARQQG